MESLRTIAAIWLAALSTIVIRSGALAEVTTVTVRVDGLACPFCAYSLEKRLKALGGVQDLVVNVQEGTAAFVPRDRKPVDYDGLAIAVNKAGFTPREMHVTGIGRLAALDGQQAIVDLDGTPLFLMVPNKILTGLGSGEKVILDFTGTVVPRTKEERLPGLPRLALTAAAPRGQPGER